MKKITLRDLAKFKGHKKISMLTCYDFPTAALLNDTNVDLLLVGDSLSNVILGHSTTIPATLEMMTLFAQAVRRGAADKFLIVDAPFGSYSTFNRAINNLSKLFQNTLAEAVKIEGASIFHLKVIERLVSSGVPVMGHIGLMPQSVHAQGGYHRHGKTSQEKEVLLQQAKDLASAGAFAVVLECVENSLSQIITEKINIPTIGIGSGEMTDGQVLVYHDLLGLTPGTPPSFVKPVANFFNDQKQTINNFLATWPKS